MPIPQVTVRLRTQITHNGRWTQIERMTLDHKARFTLAPIGEWHTRQEFADMHAVIEACLKDWPESGPLDPKLAIAKE